MLIKGEDADNIVLGDTFTKDGFDRDPDGKKRTFDYMLANPPFGVEWKQQQKYIEHERRLARLRGRFGAGLPRINDGSLLFLQHMLAKMRAPKEGGSRIGIVFNGSPLFTGDAGSGESNIRQWIIENDWLEAIVALPDQLFYNTGISTYIWVLTNRKEPAAQGQGPAHRRAALLRQDARRASATSATRWATRPTGERAGPDRRGHAHLRQLQHGETRTFTEDDPITGSRSRRPRGEQGLRQRGLRLPQDHGRAPAAAELPGDRGAHRAPGERAGLRQPRHQQEEEREGPARRRSRRASAGRRRSASSSRDFAKAHGGTLYKDREDLPDRAARGRPRGAACGSPPPSSRRCSAPWANATRPPRSAATGTATPSPTPSCATPRACR